MTSSPGRHRGLTRGAECADADLGAELTETAGWLAAVARGVELLALEGRFWAHVVDGAGNLACQLAFNGLIRALHSRPDFSLPRLEGELVRSDYRRPIAAGDAEATARTTRQALTPPEAHPWFAALPAAAEAGG